MLGAEEDSVLTQASSLLGPPLRGSEARRINERVGKKEKEREHREAWFDGLSVSWRPSGLKQNLFYTADHF